MQVRYKIYLYDTSGTKVAEITNFRGLVIVHTVNSNGYCNIILDGSDTFVDSFAGRDYTVQIYRSIMDEGIDWYLEFEGLYRTGVKQTYSNGTKTFAAYAVGFLDLLRRRVIAYYANTTYVAKSGAADDVMKEFVYENAGAGATDPPRLNDGVTAGLLIAPDTTSCSTWEGTVPYRNLLEVLQDISKDAGDCFFDVVSQVPGSSFIFHTYPDVRGTDRRYIGVDTATGLNFAGNAPVTFSTQLGNASAAVLSENTSDEVNVVYGLGQGEESSRMIEIAENNTSIGLSPWNRSEVSRNATAETTPAGVLAVANAVLETLVAVTTASFEYMPIPSCIYGLHFTWGDYVTMRYDSTVADKFIIGCTITVDEVQKETIRLDLGDIPK